MIGGFGLLWVICMAVKPRSLRGFSIQSQLFHWVHQEGEQRAEFPPVLSINEWPSWHFGDLAY